MAFPFDNVRDVELTISVGEQELSASEILSVDIRKSLTDGSFGIGFTQSDRLTFQAVSQSKFSRKTRCEVFVDIDPGEGGQLGRFYIDECTRDGSAVTVTAYDAMYFQSKATVRFTGSETRDLEALEFPCSMQDVLDYTCKLRNISCEFECEDFVVTKRPKKSDTEFFSVREIIGFIAGCHGCNAKFDNEGKLQIVPVKNDPKEITIGETIDISLDDSEPFTVHGILFELGDGTALFVKNGRLVDEDYDPDDPGVIRTYNPLATVQSAEHAWTVVGGKSYYGASVTRRGDTKISCGDILSVKNFKDPEAEENYSICATDIAYSFSASDGFMEMISSQADKSDSLGNGSVSSSASVPKYYPETEDPMQKKDESGKAVYTVSLNDRWAKLADNESRIITSLYKYVRKKVENDDPDAEPEYENVWELENNCGTGQFLGDGTTERHNDYRTVTKDEDTGEYSAGNYSNMKCDYVEGNNNKILCAYTTAPDYMFEGRNHIEGYDNTINSAPVECVHMEGRGNTFNTRGGASDTHIEGSMNTVNGGYRNHIGGLGNTVSGGTATLVHGRHNTVTNSAESAVFGGYNDVSAHQCAVFGDHNKCDNNYGLVIGSGADTQGKYYIAVGASTLGNIMTLDGAGNLYIAGSSNVTGADYAEYFEWADGNPDGEDRCGLLVMLEGDKIVPAHGDDILGVISAVPSVIGDSCELRWHGKYVRDVYGRVITTPGGEPLISPDYDPAAEYIPRSRRPEWAVVGLMGKLIVRDNGSCTSGGYCTARRGIANKTNSITRARVLRRVDDSRIEILIL